MTIDELRERRAVLDQQQRQAEARYNFLAGQLALIDQMIEEAEQEADHEHDDSEAST